MIASDRWIERHAEVIVAIPAAGIATTLSVVSLDSLWALAYFPMFWLEFALVIELVRRKADGGAPWHKLAFISFFALGLLALLYSTVGILAERSLQ